MRILVVEDSARMSQSLKQGLTEEMYAVDVAENGVDGLHQAQSGDYDLVLLDLNLPGLDGISLMKRLRESRSDIPVMMLTARDSVQEKVEGLDAGADDYLLKPFAFDELLARMRSLLRRPGARRQPLLKYDDIELDPASGQARRAGKHLPLSAREFSLLHVLLANVNCVMTRARLFEAVWSCDYDGASNVLDVYINYLRNKLESSGTRVIHTVRGRGYLLGDEYSV